MQSTGDHKRHQSLSKREWRGQASFKVETEKCFQWKKGKVTQMMILSRVYISSNLLKICHVVYAFLLHWGRTTVINRRIAAMIYACQCSGEEGNTTDKNSSLYF